MGIQYKGMIFDNPPELIEYQRLEKDEKMPQRDTPQRDTPQRDTPQRDTPQRDTPQRDTPQRDTPPKEEKPINMETLKNDILEQLKLSKLSKKEEDNLKNVDAIYKSIQKTKPIIDTRKRIPWSDIENKLFIEIYKQDTNPEKMSYRTLNKLQKVFPNRKRTSLSAHANKLGLPQEKKETNKLVKSNNKDYMKDYVQLITTKDKVTKDQMEYLNHGSVCPHKNIDFPKVFPLSDSGIETFKNILISKIGQNSNIHFTDVYNVVDINVLNGWTRGIWDTFWQNLKGHQKEICKSLDIKFEQLVFKCLNNDPYILVR